MSETAAPPLDELEARPRDRRGRGGVVFRLRVLPAAWLIIAIHLLVTASRLLRSWWWQDDLNILAGAAHRAPGPGLLFSDYNGHLVPGSWAFAWLYDRIAPLQYWPGALTVFVMVAALDVTMLALLRRMFGTRPGILVPLAMYCGTTLMLTSTLWWAAAMQWIPASLSLAAGLYFHLAYLRRRQAKDAAGAILAVLIGVLFFEKALTTPLVLAMYTVAYGVSGPLWRRPWRALREYRRYWLGHGLLIGAFLGLYLARVTIDTGPKSSRADMFETARIMLLETFLPSLIGGPLRWYSSPGTVNAWPLPALWLQIIAWLLAAAAVIGSLLFVRGAWRAWAMLAVFLGVSIGLVVRARLGFIGPFIGRDHRYLTDVAVFAPICLALAWLPLKRDEARVERPARFAGQGTRWLGRHPGTPLVAGLLAVVVMTGGGIVSGERFMHVWERNPSQGYLDTLSHELRAKAALGGTTYLFEDTVAPDSVMTPTFLDARRVGHITQPLKVRPVTGTVLPSFSVIDDSGHLSPGDVRGYQAVGVRPGDNCASDRKPATLLMSTTPEKGLWKMKLDYLANRQTTVKVAVGANPPVTMRLERGLHLIYLSLNGGGSPTISMTGLDQGASVCIGSAILGFPVAK